MTHRAQGQAGPRAEQSVPDAPLLLTLRGAAALSVSPRTVRRLLEAGDLAPVRIGRAVRVSAADLAAYVDSRITRGNTAPGVAVPETTPCQDVRPRARKDSTHTPTRRATGVLIAEDLEGLKAQAIRAAWRAQGKAQETGERATFDDLLLLYRQQVTPAKRAPERDRRSAKALFPAFTGRVPESAKAAHVRGYIAGRTAAGIAAGTINEVGLMSAALNWARKELVVGPGQPAGLEDVHPHDLRRTFGSWLVQAGVGIERVSELLRHHDVAITARDYAHLRPGDLAEAAAVLDGKGPGIAHGLAHGGEEPPGRLQYTTATDGLRREIWSG